MRKSSQFFRIQGFSKEELFTIKVFSQISALFAAIGFTQIQSNPTDNGFSGLMTTAVLLTLFSSGVITFVGFFHNDSDPRALRQVLRIGVWSFFSGFLLIFATLMYVAVSQFRFSVSLPVIHLGVWLSLTIVLLVLAAYRKFLASWDYVLRLMIWVLSLCVVISVLTPVFVTLETSKGVLVLSAICRDGDDCASQAKLCDPGVRTGSRCSVISDVCVDSTGKFVFHCVQQSEELKFVFNGYYDNNSVPLNECKAIIGTPVCDNSEECRCTTPGECCGQTNGNVKFVCQQLLPTNWLLVEQNHGLYHYLNRCPNGTPGTSNCEAKDTYCEDVSAKVYYC